MISCVYIRVKCWTDEARPLLQFYYVMIDECISVVDKALVYAAIIYTISSISLIPSAVYKLLDVLDEGTAILYANKKLKDKITPEINAKVDEMLNAWVEKNIILLDYAVNECRNVILKHEDMNTNEFETLMKELKSADSRYICYDCKEGMLFLESNTGWQCLLVDKKDKSFVELVDKDGNMVAFTLKDVEKSVLDRDVETGNAHALLVRYRFFVYDFKGGKAEVEWTICPDGRYFADEDGFGGEDCDELTVTAVIDRKGKVLVPFH